MGVRWMDADYLLPAATAKIQPVNTVLDIGCGIRPQNYISPKLHICWEPFLQYIQCFREKVQNVVDPIYLFVNATWEEAIKLLPPKSVDSIFLLDVIEHLEKEYSMRLLKATENIARCQIVIFTPMGFLPQYSPDGKDKWGLDGGAWQEHKSGWLPEDFDDSWDILAAEHFHQIDNISYGAIWAFKTY